MDTSLRKTALFRSRAGAGGGGSADRTQRRRTARPKPRMDARAAGTQAHQGGDSWRVCARPSSDPQRYVTGVATIHQGRHSQPHYGHDPDVPDRSHLDRLAHDRRPEDFHEMVERIDPHRSEEHTSELQSLMRISYAVFCLKKKTNSTKETTYN